MLENRMLFLSSIANTKDNTDEEKRQHSFLIYIGGLMSLGGILWGSISFFSGLYMQASLPYGYTLITILNFSYLYYSKNFSFSQALQLFISILLPFLFQLSLGGFVSSGAMVLWSILAILGAFTFKKAYTTIRWFILYLSIILASGLLDSYVQHFALDVPSSISTLFFTINISAISTIIFTLFYYFVDSEKKYRESLQENLASLQNAQDQLIEAEKMSSLGSLVAGVAHEVNTPLGISITAASIFKNEITNLKEAVDTNALKKTTLNDFIENITKTDELLIKNLDRAALLIRNFKKISVDQSSDDLREFELNDYTTEIVSTLHNELRNHQVDLHLDLSSEPIHMHSYPGALAQIIINLIQNCLLHGFDEMQEGEIIVTTKPNNQHAIISCCDNGKGIHGEVIHHIFEPFVTTKRNKGGTGLGLNITYNLATQQLKGTIKVDEEYTQGACFILEIPLKIEETSPLKHLYSI